MTGIVDLFKHARAISTPIVAVTTADPAATIVSLVEATNGVPKLRWDKSRGLVGLNDEGAEVISQLIAPQMASVQSMDPTASVDPTTIARSLTAELDATLKLALELPKNSMLFVLNAHLFLSERFAGRIDVIQGIWNLRDDFKATGRMLVLLAPSIQLPDELAHDVMVLDEPLPGTDELREIIEQEYANFELEPKKTERAIDAVRGLSAFEADQAMAMSLRKKTGLDLPGLWERKRQRIEQSDSMKVYRGTETFADVEGLVNFKTFLGNVLRGKRKPGGIVFYDELEKSFAGLGGDSSGTTTEQLGEKLKFMQDNEVTGIICIGPGGSGKSAVCKAAGNEAGLITICHDLAGTKNKYVGESLNRLKNDYKVIKAVTDGRPLFLATVNSIGILPPELRRRFTLGTFMFDLPTKEERTAIWKLYLKKFKIKEQTLPQDESWTGAEIRQCCDITDRLNVSLVEAAAFIVPIATSAADVIERLRAGANGKYISASTPGLYRWDGPAKAPAPVAVARTGRQVQ